MEPGGGAHANVRVQAAAAPRSEPASARSSPSPRLFLISWRRSGAAGCRRGRSDPLRALIPQVAASGRFVITVAWTVERVQG